MEKLEMPWDCYYNQLPEIMKVIIFVELLLFYIMFLSAIFACLYCKFQQKRFEKELKRNENLNSQL